jgi:hypothetical protein
MAPLENLMPHQMHTLPTPVMYACAQAFRIRLLTSPLALLMMAHNMKMVESACPAPRGMLASAPTSTKGGV